MKPGDVVIGAFPGAKVTKTRPAVVLSTELYHQHRPDVVLGLITTQLPLPLTPADCQLVDWKVAGLRAPSYFLLYLVTLEQAEVRLIGRLSEADWRQVLKCFQAGFGTRAE